MQQTLKINVNLYLKTIIRLICFYSCKCLRPNSFLMLLFNLNFPSKLVIEIFSSLARVFFNFYASITCDTRKLCNPYTAVSDVTLQYYVIEPP